MVPARSNSRRSSSGPAIASKMPLVSPCCSSRWRKRRIVLSSGTTSSPSSTPREPAHRLAVVNRILGLRVRKVEPLLQEVDPQHLLQPQRLAPLSGFRIMRLDQRNQPRPRNHRIHLGQKPLAPGHFALRFQASDANVRCSPITAPPLLPFNLFLCTSIDQLVQRFPRESRNGGRFEEIWSKCLILLEPPAGVEPATC